MAGQLRSTVFKIIIALAFCLIALPAAVSADEVDADKAAVKSGVDVNIDNKSGWFRVTISGVPADTARVLVPVWDAGDGQDDLHWYEAALQSDGTYVATANLYYHGFDADLYYFDVYTEDAAGSRTYFGGSTATFTHTKGQVSFNVTTMANTATISGIMTPGGFSSIKYAVWSDSNWQDDLKWYKASYDSATESSSVEYSPLDFQSYGLYYIDVYGVNCMGKSIYLGGTTYEVTEKGVNVEIDAETGWFLVMIKGVENITDVQSVLVPVWSVHDGQDDLYWYTAQKRSDGIYVVNKNLYNHKFDTGKYYFDVYVVDSAGKKSYFGGNSATFPASSGGVTIQSYSGGYTVSINGITAPGGLKGPIKYAVWSEEGGQDDLKWYSVAYDTSAKASTISYSSADFSTSGKYNVHVYGLNNVGKNVFLGSATYEAKYGVYDSYAAEVMRNIIYAVETGGQIYGNARYNDFTPAYNSSCTERAITIGAGAWYATEAQRLLTLIRQADPTLFASLDTAGIGSDLDSQNWNIYGSDGTRLTSSNYKSLRDSHRTITVGSAKAVAIQNIINTDIGRAMQDQLIDEQMEEYIASAEQLGVTDLKAKMFCANLRHLGGSGGMRRVITNCKNDGLALTMENLWATMLKHDSQASGATQVGSPIYHTRHQKVMQWLNTYIGN